MPDEPFFRNTEVQRKLLDVLFIFCKLNQDVGYRQGMHELLAPILWVIESDALKIELSDQESISDGLMGNVLDPRFIEHDAFTLFALVMQTTKSFYELGEVDKRLSVQSSSSSQSKGVSPIVARSKQIHEDYLMRVDPELANHLTTIEILPQIFLM